MMSVCRKNGGSSLGLDALVPPMIEVIALHFTSTYCKRFGESSCPNLQYNCLANGGIGSSSHDFTTWKGDLIPS